MKKTLSLFLCVCMLLLTASCHAEGLTGLGGLGGLGGLPKINGNAANNPEYGYLPDPKEILNQKGTLFASDYDFAVGYRCKVYTYPIPKDVDAFAAKYAARAQENGFQVENVQVEGYPALKLSFDSLYALLLPEYSGVTMLLIQNGMKFGTPKEGYYLTFVRNGTEFTYNDPLTNIYGVYSSSYGTRIPYYEIIFDGGNSWIGFPKSSAKDGAAFVVNKNNKSPDVRLLLNSTNLIDYAMDSPSIGLEVNSDHFEIVLTSVTEDVDYVYVEGEFSASLRSGKLVIEDGEFRVRFVK